MIFSACRVVDARVVDPTPRVDERGRFARAWCSDEFANAGIRFVPVQANTSSSKRKGTMRGMHYQVAPALEAKLVRCTKGSILDVVVDVRADSPTYGLWHAETLSGENGRMLFVPEGCAHGCVSLEDDTEIYYLTSAFYSPECVRGVRFDDPTFAVAWPIEVKYVSDQDRAWPLVVR